MHQNESEFMRELGARIRRLREARGLSQGDVGPQPSVSAWERGDPKRMPDAQQLRHICRTLDVSSDYLLGLCPEEHLPPQGYWLRDLDLKEQNDAAIANGAADAVAQGEFFRVPHRFELLAPADAAAAISARNDGILKSRNRRIRRRHEDQPWDLPKRGASGPKSAS